MLISKIDYNRTDVYGNSANYGYCDASCYAGELNQVV